MGFSQACRYKAVVTSS